jgi:putative SOS response-associated peptidase YedK
LAEFSILENPAALEPRYNVAPSQGVWAVRVVLPAVGPELHLLRWGFELTRQGEVKETVMARAETLMGSSAFADALASRRCILLADGFYEWRRSRVGPAASGARLRGRSVPYLVQRAGGAPFAMAGIWQPLAARTQRTLDGALAVDGCAVITRPARPPVAAFHDRMPAFIAARDHAAWLDPSFNDRSALARMLFAAPEFDLEAIVVGPRVNSTAHDDDTCVLPAPDGEAFPEQLALFAAPADSGVRLGDQNRNR